MVITQDELAARRSCIGASDAGIILGLSPWKSPADLWHDKVYGCTFKGNAATRRGNLFEPLVIQQFEEWGVINGLGDPTVVVPDVRYERCWTTKNGTVVPFRANTDGVVVTEGCHPKQYDRYLYGECVPQTVVEAKTARSIDHWGLPGTSDVPDTYLVQTCVQMWCSGAEHAYIPVQSGFDFYVYSVPRPDEVKLEEIIETCAEWWAAHVTTKTKPEGPPASVAVLTTIPRTEGSSIALDESVHATIMEWERTKRQRQLLVAKERELKQQLLAALDNAEMGELPQGFLTYLANRKGHRTLKWEDNPRWNTTE